ncbi:MAG TPA: serine/threonine-protein kinase [Kofleriaceae bacterium]
MPKHAEFGWDEPSEPEISVGALIRAHADDFKGNIIGERFGKYLLVGEIAVGGMAEVFLAVHKGVEGFIKVVVIKRVLPHLINNTDFTRMFVDEARLEARLEHPNIVRTYEFGEVNGQYYTAMEYLPGEDLCKALNNLSISRQLMPVHIAAGITNQLCAGLHFAHHFTDTDGQPLNLVHRDINPANIIVTYGGEVKIIDFGVAKSKTNVQTLTGMIKGKVAYMPPEQVLGREVDHRADIFSAGVVLWEMLTGRPLFLRSNEAATLYAIMNAPIPPPSRLRAEVPRQLDEIVRRAVARAPEDRYENAEQMGAALEDFMVHVPRFDARVLGSKVEELFGSTRAEAKRSIAQTRALTRNISMVMKLRTEVRAELAERLDAAVHDDIPRARPSTVGPAHHAPPVPTPIVAQSRPQGGLMIALAVVMVTGIGAGIGYMMWRPDQQQVARIAQAAIEITSTPPGAAVFVGGEPTGLKTPTTLTGITKTQLEIRLELAGHAPVTKTVEARSGTTTSTQVTLTALQGRIVVSDLPSSAVVFVDTEEYAAGEVMPVAAGRHTIRIVIDGRTVAEQSTDTTTGDQYWKFARGKLVRN